MKLLVFEGNGSRVRVTQADLENVLAFDARICRAQQMRDQIASSILSRINEGAAVEDGPRTYDIEERYEAGVHLEKLIVR